MSRPSPAKPASTAPRSTATDPTRTCASSSNSACSDSNATDTPLTRRPPRSNVLKADLDALRTRLAQANTTIDQLTDFRTQALARLAAQHEEILRLRGTADPKINVAHLPAARPRKVIGPC
jgi:hypothetical protein